ncbi:MAG TPA: zf-HC2 domain-containing protein [Gemmatimonadales bacterium]|nr:zf-HC2 domain-containing protein [Gemmatimonadales bacterium]
MSHVDEGTLHSYLDGELSADERAAVEIHLSQCATCRASLAGQRALLERASAVLGVARPIERPAPPFEQLRRQSKRSPWRVRRSIAWAASIVLAIGLGYSLRGTAPEASPEADTFALHDRRDAPVAQSEGATEQRQLKAPAGARRPAPTASAPFATPRADEVARQRESDSVVATVAVRVDSVSALAASRGQAAAPAPRPLDTIRGRVSNVVAGAGERERVELGQPAINAAKTRQLTAGSLIVINRQVARALLGQEPVGLPGLTPRSFRRTPDGTVVVEQALDSSTLIQIFQRPASSAALSDSVSGYTRAFAFARTDRLLARYVGTLRVEIAGPVSPDSLNKLLEQVAPLP